MKNAAIKLCVVGHGISYSLSPAVHQAIFAFLGERGTYSVEDIPPDTIEGEIDRLTRDYDGFNITKPYKEIFAARFGSSVPINTYSCADGRFTSTDPEGFISDYIDAFGEPHGTILLLGAGGAAKSVATAFRGYDVDLYVYNRTYAKAKHMESGRVKAVENAGGAYDAVINCTSLGLCGEQAAPHELDFTKVKYAYDLVYSPPVTPFMQKAASAGAKACGGFGMLVYQAIAAHEFWRGEEFAASTRKELYGFVKSKISL